MSLVDLSNVVENGGPIENGTYPVVVDSAEVAATTTGGQRIKVSYRVTGQQQHGRVIFDSFNIKNANPQAVQIGLSQLKGMMKAFGHQNPNQLQSCTELLGLKGQVTTKVEPGKNGYSDQARVTAYKPAGSGMAGGEVTATEAGPGKGSSNPFV